MVCSALTLAVRQYGGEVRRGGDLVISKITAQVSHLIGWKKHHTHTLH